MAWRADESWLQLVVAGVASEPQLWRGGLGTLFVDEVTGTPGFEYQHPGGSTWLPVKELSGNAPLTSLVAGHYTFALPASVLVRISAGGGSMAIRATGV